LLLCLRMSPPLQSSYYSQRRFCFFDGKNWLMYTTCL